MPEVGTSRKVIIFLKGERFGVPLFLFFISYICIIQTMIKVGIISGGPSAEHDVSLKTGREVLANLSAEKYSAKDIFLSKNGEWIFEGKFSNPEKIFRSVDVIFNALHGAFGEDGKVQQLMEMFCVPYTGSGVMASALGMNKSLSKESFRSVGLNVPMSMVINSTEEPVIAAKKVFSRIGPPWMIKPVSGGSSLGNLIARNFYELAPVLEDAFDFSDNILVEEFIKGKEATCGVIENFRNSKHYALPVTEIISPKDSFF